MKTSNPLAQGFYRRLRPLLDDLGLLRLARRVFPAQRRWALADRLGLAGFRVLEATGSRLPAARARTLAGPRQVRRIDGLNLVGDLRADMGLGEVSRQLIQSLRAVNLGAAYTEMAGGAPSRSQPLPEGLTAGAPYDVSLMDIFFPTYYDRIQSAPAAVLDGKYLIAYWGWELPKFPALSEATFKLLDEAWVYSRFVQQSLQAVCPAPVVVMPPAVAVTPSGPPQRAAFDLPADRFIFLFSFNPLSGVARKNPFGLIEAFRRAFGRAETGPLLVIKTQHLAALNAAGPVSRKLREAVQSVGGRLIEQNVTRQQMTDLLNCADCYVSLHRAEGFGLGMAEAMRLGKPVIGTGYSGNTDFLLPDHSWPVRFTERAITLDDHRDQPDFLHLYEPGQIWAEPDLDHAAELMQQVYAHPEQAAQMGAAASAFVRQNFSPAAIGQRIRDRLETIAATVH